MIKPAHNAVVLDTDVCSFLFKKNRHGQKYLPHLTDKTLCLAFQSVAELYYGIELAGWSEARKLRLREWLRRFVILPYDNQVALAWARLRVERRQQPISAQDAWIAACALRYGCPLITHNASYYRSISNLTIITEPDFPPG